MTKHIIAPLSGILLVCSIIFVSISGIISCRGELQPEADNRTVLKILYVANADAGSNSDIYIMNPDGSNKTMLTDSSTQDGAPRWSPDGTKIVFVSHRDGNREVYVMNAGGSNPTNLTTNPAMDGFPAWSPDGSKIAFDSNREDGTGQIYIMNADGSNQTRLTYNLSGDDGYPSWSPDGTKIVFDSNFGPGGEGNMEIYEINATDGSNLTNLNE